MEGILGVILAGGQSRRFGSDKGLAVLAGKTLLQHVIDRAVPQVEALVISAAIGSTGREMLGFPVVRDRLGPGLGPLAGILAGMDWAIRHRPNCGRLATFPIDSPFFPKDIVRRLNDCESGRSGLVVPERSGQLHPVFGLWPIELRETLRHYLLAGHSGVQAFCRSVGATILPFEDATFDPFLNINRPEDLENIVNILGSTFHDR